MCAAEKVEWEKCTCIAIVLVGRCHNRKGNDLNAYECRAGDPYWPKTLKVERNMCNNCLFQRTDELWHVMRLDMQRKYQIYEDSKAGKRPLGYIPLSGLRREFEDAEDREDQAWRAHKRVNEQRRDYGVYGPPRARVVKYEQGEPTA